MRAFRRRKNATHSGSEIQHHFSPGRHFSASDHLATCKPYEHSRDRRAAQMPPPLAGPCGETRSGISPEKGKPAGAVWGSNPNGGEHSFLFREHYCFDSGTWSDSRSVVFQARLRRGASGARTAIAIELADREFSTASSGERSLGGYMRRDLGR